MDKHSSFLCDSLMPMKHIFITSKSARHDIQKNDTQHNDVQRNNS